MAEGTSRRGADGGDSEVGYYIDSFLVPLLNSFCEDNQEEVKQKKKLLVSKEKLQILVPACSTLPLQIYERGFKNITVADNDKALMTKMMREHLRDRPEMRWRIVDITRMTKPVAASTSKTETKALELGSKAEVNKLPWFDNDNRLLKFVARASRVYLIFVGDDAQGCARTAILVTISFFWSYQAFASVISIVTS